MERLQVRTPGAQAEGRGKRRRETALAEPCQPRTPGARAGVGGAGAVETERPGPARDARSGLHEQDARLGGGRSGVDEVDVAGQDDKRPRRPERADGCRRAAHRGLRPFGKLLDRVVHHRDAGAAVRARKQTGKAFHHRRAEPSLPPDPSGHGVHPRDDHRLVLVYGLEIGGDVAAVAREGGRGRGGTGRRAARRGCRAHREPGRGAPG